MLSSTQVIIMAGDIGSRFWPMSPPRLPKAVHRRDGRGTFPHPAHRRPSEAHLPSRAHVGGGQREIYQHRQGANP